jgi:hypothetical protein
VCRVQTGIGHGTEAGAGMYPARRVAIPESLCVCRSLAHERSAFLASGTKDPTGIRAAMLSRRAAGRIMQWTVTGRSTYAMSIVTDLFGSLRDSVDLG